MVYSSFCAIRAELSSWDRDLMAVLPKILTIWPFIGKVCTNALFRLTTKSIRDEKRK